MSFMRHAILGISQALRYGRYLERQAHGLPPLAITPVFFFPASQHFNINSRATKRLAVRSSAPYKIKNIIPSEREDNEV